MLELLRKAVWSWQTSFILDWKKQRLNFWLGHFVAPVHIRKNTVISNSFPADFQNHSSFFD
jgi:hypothetical protein